MQTSGLTTSRHRHRRRQAAGGERDLLHQEREDAGRCKHPELPAREHPAQPVGLEQRAARLPQRGRQPVEQPRARAVGPRLLGRGASPAGDEERTSAGREHGDGDRPLPAGRAVVAGGGVPDQREHGEPDHHECGGHDLRPVHDLAGEEVPERQREDDRRHQQGLDHRQFPVVERDRLADVPAEEGDRAQEPPRLADQADEGGGRAQRHLAHPERTLLLERCRQREQERRTEGQDASHAARV